MAIQPTYNIKDDTKKALRREVLWTHAENIVRNQLDLIKLRCFKLKNFYAPVISQYLAENKYLKENPVIKKKLDDLLFKKNGKFKKGVPDLIQIDKIHKPKFIEVKNGQSKLNEEQIKKMNKIMDLGFWYYTAYCNITAEFNGDDDFKIIAEHVKRQKKLEEQNKKNQFIKF